ncbi:MAG: selenocysteine-specific translation elongation factor [Desulfobacteraceae bacterium]|nr:MAG: selenocysteine-specific translation elongation factor [Desulfobacteraceae bacterium]
MKQIILGTAGHIDHGKTTLVKALTGVDTDRLKEEKARGITIELGFAHLELPGGELLGIVDVPGHEKFVKNMVAGATGIDLVALVIAADEGVMPQTREHLEICQLLRVRSGLVILTKVDLVDAEWLELVKEDVSNFLSGTFLAGAPMVEVSSTTGRGIDDLLKTLDHLVKGVSERDTGSFFRLPIDRVFTMKGFGTVVTGTTISGQIDLGEEATIYPKDVTSKIRGIQVHNREVTRVSAGLRTAINLQAVEKAEIERGDVLGSKDLLKPTQLVDVTIDLLKSAPRKLKHRTKVRFHTGTAEIISTVLFLDRDDLSPGETCFAQIRLEKPTVLLARDRYVIRSYSPVRAIGGGEVLNVLPERRKRRSEKSLSELKTLSRGDLNEIAEQFVHTGRFRGIEQAELPFLTNTSRKRLEEVLKKLLAQKKVVLYDREKGGLIHSEFLQEARDEITSTLDRYHRENPLKEGFHKEELRSRTAGSRNPKLFQFLINQLTSEGVVVQEKETLRLGSHKVTLAEDQQKVRRRIDEIYLKGGLQPPYFKEIKDQFASGGNDVLQVMLKEGVLVKVKEDLYFHRDILAALRDRLTEHLKEKGEIDTPQFKEMTNASRKYTIPLLEYFDITQVTVRVGDKRVLRRK